jgi:hypothetical protein
VTTTRSRRCCNFFHALLPPSLSNYVGLPLLVDKLPKSALLPRLDQMADQLSARKGKLMHCSGCLALIKSTLSAIPMYTAMSHDLPAWLLKSFVKISKAFLWTGMEVVNGGKCSVASCRV